MKTGKLETRPNPKQAVFRTSVNSNARDNAWYPIDSLTKPLGGQPQFENGGVLAKVGLIVYEMFNSPWHLDRSIYVLHLQEEGKLRSNRQKCLASL